MGQGREKKYLDAWNKTFGNFYVTNSYLFLKKLLLNFQPLSRETQWNSDQILSRLSAFLLQIYLGSLFPKNAGVQLVLRAKATLLPIPFPIPRLKNPYSCSTPSFLFVLVIFKRNIEKVCRSKFTCTQVSHKRN